MTVHHHACVFVHVEYKDTRSTSKVRTFRLVMLDWLEDRLEVGLGQGEEVSWNV